MNRRTFQAGFSVFEMVIGLLIGSILLTSSLAIYQNIVKSTTTLQRITTNDTKVMVLQDRLQKDLIGISMLWFTPKKYEAMNKQKNESKNIAKSSQGQEKTKKESSSKKPQKTGQDNSFFFAENNNGNIRILSFVTTSALQMYGAESKLLVRAIYMLKKNSTDGHSFSLLRKEIEAGELQLESLEKAGTFYELASNIKHCSFEYGFINGMKTEEESKNEDKQAKMTWVKDWNDKKDPSGNSIEKPVAPKCIKIKIVFLQQESSVEHEYNFLCMLECDNIAPYTSFTEKQYESEQNQQNNTHS